MPYVLAILLLLSAAACRRQSAVPTAGEEAGAEGAPVQESWDVRFSIYESTPQSDDSQPRLEIEAGYLAKYDQGDTTFTVLRSHPDTTRGRVTVRLFDAAGALSATVTARRLVYHDAAGRFEARGDVVVRTEEGRRLQTETLFWNEHERKVRTPGFARITSPTEDIQGYGLVADEDLASYSLARVTGQVTVEEE